MDVAMNFQIRLIGVRARLHVSEDLHLESEGV